MDNLNQIWTSRYAGYKLVKKPISQNVLEFLTTESFRDTVMTYRGLTTPAEKDTMSAFNYPCITTSAICEGSHGNPKQHTGLIALDFDGANKGQNLHITDWPLWIMKLKWMEEIFFAGLSRSGSGAVVVIPLLNATLENHIEYFLYLQEWFRDNYRVTIDKQCKNVNRLRFAAYNTPETSFFNINAKPWKRRTQLPEFRPTKPSKFIDMDSSRRIASLVKWCDRYVQFTQGSRHSYMVKLAGACCRFGVSQEDVIQYMMNLWGAEATENADDISNTIKGAYTKYPFGCAIQ
jgi:hypothetical protein